MSTHLRSQGLVEHLLDRRRADCFAEWGDEHAIFGEQARVTGVVAGIEVLAVIDEDLPDLLTVFELLEACGVGHELMSPKSY